MLGHGVKSRIYYEYFYTFCVQINSPAHEIGCVFGRQEKADLLCGMFHAIKANSSPTV